MYQHLVVTTGSSDSAFGTASDAVARYLYSGKVIGAATDLNRGITSVVVENVPAQLVNQTIDRLASGLYFAKAYDDLGAARTAAGLDDPTFDQGRPAVVCPRCGEGSIDIVVQSWERTTYVNGVKTEVSVDSESLDFFVHATCGGCTLALTANGDGLRSSTLTDSDMEEIDDEDMRDAFVALVNHLHG